VVKGKHRRGAIPPEEKQAGREAIAANVDASKALHEARARTSEVETMSEALKRLRERNHFGEMVIAALNGR
jgi:hypothetical protein